MMKLLLQKTFVGILTAVLVGFLGITSTGQAPHDTTHAADRNLKSSARVNPSTYAMELSIPLMAYPGRAGNSVPVTLNYSSKIWSMKHKDMFKPTINTGIYSGSGSHNDPHRIFQITWFDPLATDPSDRGGWTVPGLEPIALDGDNREYNETIEGWQYKNFVKRLRVVMPDNSSHEFRKDDKLYKCQGYPDQNDDCTVSGFYSVDGTYLAVDGSGMRLEVSSITDSVLYMPDGGRYLIGIGSHTYIDRNGNKTFFDIATKTLTDTLGRQIQNPVNESGTFTLPGFGEGNLSYSQTYRPLKPEGCVDGTESSCADAALENPADEIYYLGNDTCPNMPSTPVQFGPISGPSLFEVAAPVDTYWANGIEGSAIYYRQTELQLMCAPNERFNGPVLAELQMPDGSKYKFKYNRYGEITKIIYPTGAYERFTYDFMPAGGFPFSQVNRGVTNRWVSEDGVNETQHWVYSRPAAGVRTTVNPDNTKSERVVFESGTMANGFEDPRAGMVYDEKFYSAPTTPGSEATREMLRRELTDWIVAPPRPGGTATYGNRDARVSKKISIVFEPGATHALAQLFETTYDSNSDPEYFAHLNAKQVKSYNYVVLDLNTAKQEDFATIIAALSTSTVAKVVESDYLYDSSYKARNITGLVSETRVLNPTNQTQVLGKSQFIYDEATYFDNTYTTTNWENPNSTLRGNATTARTWNRDTDTWIESHTMFDNFGNPRKVWDTSGDGSRFVETQYDPAYKYAYSTKTIAPAPDPTGVHGTTEASAITRTYDFRTGLLTSVEDANGQTATIEYNDPLLRQRKVNPPPGGSVSETIYNDTPGNVWVKSRQQIDDVTWAERTTFYDNLGRAVKTRTKDAQGDVMSQVRFDGFGRVEKTSNPYRVDASGNPTETVYWSKLRYDIANRVVETFAPAPDGETGQSLGTAQFGISTLPGLVGTYAVTIDASRRKSRAISGMYGLMRVDEATATGGTADQDLGTLASPTQATHYSYNIKGELTQIAQGVQNRYFMYDSLGRLVKVRQPEQTPNANLATTGNPENNQWTAGYTYDVFGNVTSVTDAKNITITNLYDKAGRTTKRTYSDGTPEVEYFYDGRGLGLPQPPQFSKGSLTKVTSSVSEDRFTSFDNHGRLLASQQITDGRTYSFGYKYNLAGGLVEQTYPSGTIVRTFLDGDGGLSAVTAKAMNGLTEQVASNFDYSTTGAVRKMKLGNGLWETAEFSHLQQLTQIGLGTTQTNKNLFKVDYEYGELSDDRTTVDAGKNVGNIARTTTTIPTTSFVQTFKYDAINRLTEAVEKTVATQNWRQTFGHDRYGNRTSRYQVVGTDVLAINNLTQPTIDATNNRFTTGQGYVYDLNGNLIENAEGRKFTFNGDDKQTEVRNASDQVIAQYAYDGSGARVKKHFPSTGETTVFVYDASGALAAEYSTAAPPVTPTTSYLTTDNLGSPRVITDENGEVIARRDFMPFGEELGAGVGPRTEALKYSVTGSDNIRQRFTGYEKDDETGLDFAEARMYQNKHGRFTAPDPLLASANAANPQTFNRYVYTGNNPINNSDPSGLAWCRSSSGATTFTGEGNPCPTDSDTEKWEDIDDTTGVLLRGHWPSGAQNGDLVRFNGDGSLQVLVRDEARTAVREGVQVRAEQEEIRTTPAAGVGTGMLSLCARGMVCPVQPSGPPIVIDLTQGASAKDVLNFVRDVADTVGLIPGLGEPADAISLAISWGEGDTAGVILSACALNPFGGQACGGAKLARRFGRLGGDATRKQIDEIARTLEGRGYTITGGAGRKEEYLKPLFGGRRGGSYIDITAEHPKYGTLRINTVDTLKNGKTPTARERRNAARIRKQIGRGKHLLLIPKRK